MIMINAAMGLDPARSNSNWIATDLLLSMHDVALWMTEYPWSPIGWRDGVRRSENFLGSMYLALDFDGTMSLEQALRMFCDCQHVIGTTRNHQIDKDGITCDRIRVVIPFTSVILNIPEFLATQSHYVEKFDADPKCKDAARWYYPCKEIISVSDEGYTQDIIQPQPKPERRKATRYAKHQMLRSRTLQYLDEPFPVGQRDDRCFICAKDILDSGRTADEAFAIIMESPAQAANEYPLSEHDVWKCITSALKSIETGRAYG